jgi:hypothetical protein
MWTRRSAASSTGLDVGGEPTLGLGDALLEELLTLVQPGVAHLELTTSGGEHRRACLEVGAGLATGASGIGLRLLVGVEGRQDGLELRDTTAFDGHVPGELRDGTVEGLDLARELTSLTEHPSETLGRSGEPGVVLVELAGELVLQPPCCVERVLRCGQFQLGDGEVGRGERRTFLGFGERRCCRTAGGGADAPPGGSEPVTPAGHDHAGRVFDRGVDRGGGVGDAHRRANQRVEQTREVVAQRAHVRSHGLTDRGCGR